MQDPNIVDLMQISRFLAHAHSWGDGVLPLLYAGLACLCGWTSWRVRLCCGMAQVNRPTTGYRRRRRLWLIGAAVLFSMALAVGTGLVDAAVEQFRLLAFRDGWYAQRWWVQAPIAGLAAALLIVAVCLIWRRRREWYRRDQWMLTAFGVLLCTIGLRALSQHHVDVVLGWDALGIALGRWIECSALALLAMTAVHTMRCRTRHAADVASTCGTVRDDCNARCTVSISTDVSNGL